MLIALKESVLISSAFRLCSTASIRPLRIACNSALIGQATGTFKSRGCNALCTSSYPSGSTKSKELARRVLKVSSALVETAASIAVAATVVGAAATILVRRNNASEAIEAPPRICEDCGGSGVCADCIGEGSVLKKMLPKKWGYCMKRNAARSCSSRGGVGKLN
ncbi:hypothetical protein H5410_030590 [Solanum commersonii]|uniref:DUF7895 domain-containing protein n=1 Tax=Solanum commersonii TaxID=4109 RepID=A0A9J5YJ51_SOLCO|nr:hypothetical protein H5410_030590 [Solanum commersonii]